MAQQTAATTPPETFTSGMAAVDHLAGRQIFQITARIADRITRYVAVAGSSGAAFADAADTYGDIPCGITVTPVRVRP
jgi:hypothetical protein